MSILCKFLECTVCLLRAISDAHQG
jgi:hypothetical protein